MISLEQSEYVVYDENGSLSVTITISNVTSQDVIVEVTITDGTATGKNMHVQVHIYVAMYFSWDGLQCNIFSVQCDYFCWINIIII